MKNDNTGVYIILGFAVIGVVGVWAYNQYIKPKVDAVAKTTSFLDYLK